MNIGTRESHYLFCRSLTKLIIITMLLLTCSSQVNAIKIGDLIRSDSMQKSIIKSAGFAAAAYVLGHLTSACVEPAIGGEGMVDGEPAWVSGSAFCGIACLAGLAAKCGSIGISILNIMPSCLLDKSATPRIAATKAVGLGLASFVCGCLAKKSLEDENKEYEPWARNALVSATMGGIAAYLAAKHGINCIQLIKRAVL